MRGTALSLLLLCATAGATREPMQNADIAAKRFEKRKQYAKALAWRKASLMTLTYITRPLDKEFVRYGKEHGDTELVQRHKRSIKRTDALEKELRDLIARLERRADPREQGLKQEQQKVQGFLDQFIPHYPDNFQWFYQRRYAARIKGLRGRGDHAKADRLEAEAADEQARWYEVVAVAFYEKNPEFSGSKKKAELYRKKVAYLRKRAEVHRRRAGGERVAIEKELSGMENPRSLAQTRLTMDRATRIARGDRKVKRFLQHNGGAAVRDGWFQGAYWLVRIVKGERELAFVYVDDANGKVVDLEER